MIPDITSRALNIVIFHVDKKHNFINLGKKKQL